MKQKETGLSQNSEGPFFQLVASRRPELLHVCLQGEQIKDASHFRGCKSAPGDGSGVSDTPNPPRAASTYRLPIHVSSKWTLQTSSIIKCSSRIRCVIFFQLVQKCLAGHHNGVVCFFFLWMISAPMTQTVENQVNFWVYQLWHFKLPPENSNTNRAYQFII